MNYLTKILSFLRKLAFVFGLFVILGAVGNAELDLTYPLWKTVIQMGIGFAMMLPQVIKFIKWEVIG